jgi:hypothetical protein
MRVCRLIALLGLTGFCCVPAGAEECNYWPLTVEQTAPAKPAPERGKSWQAVGPLFFDQTAADGSISGGFRPFFVQ